MYRIVFQSSDYSSNEQDFSTLNKVLEELEAVEWHKEFTRHFEFTLKGKDSCLPNFSIYLYSEKVANICIMPLPGNECYFVQSNKGKKGRFFSSSKIQTKTSTIPKREFYTYLEDLLEKSMSDQ